MAAMRWASSRVRRCAAERRSRLLLEIDVGERLPAGVADDEADARSWEDPGLWKRRAVTSGKNNAIGEVLGKLFKAGGNYDREYLARPRVP